MQGGSIGFPLSLTMKGLREQLLLADPDAKKGPCNGNTSANVYSPSQIKMDMGICCDSS